MADLVSYASAADRLAAKLAAFQSAKKSGEFTKRRRGRSEQAQLSRAERDAISGHSSRVFQNFGHGQSALPTRAMFNRISSVAAGSQPAVVKLTSYGPGSRLNAMANYISRDGELTVENEKGERSDRKDLLGSLRDDWSDLLSERKESRDVGTFTLEIKVKDESTWEQAGDDDAVRQTLVQAFGDRSFAFKYQKSEVDQNSFRVDGLVVLRSSHGERLTADQKATDIIQARLDNDTIGSIAASDFAFTGYGNGVDYAVSRVQSLSNRDDGLIHTNKTDHANEDPLIAEIRRDWRGQMESRKVRDVMHVMVSSRAGTDVQAFENATRDFLASSFAHHRYVWSVHDPENDPKEAGDGGKRPHVHAHAIVTMRSEQGEAIRPSISTFKEWREDMAYHARENGIEMEMTDRREVLSAPAFRAEHVRPKYNAEASHTEHEPVSKAARARVEAKKNNSVTIHNSDKSEPVMSEARQVWQQIAREPLSPEAFKAGQNQMARFEKRLDMVGYSTEEKLESIIYHARDFTPTTDTERHSFSARLKSVTEEASTSDLSKDREVELYHNITDSLAVFNERYAKHENIRSSLNGNDREYFDKVTTERNDLAYKAAVGSFTEQDSGRLVELRDEYDGFVQDYERDHPTIAKIEQPVSQSDVEPELEQEFEAAPEIDDPKAPNKDLIEQSEAIRRRINENDRDDDFER